ncbi:MAG: hypothetical protein EBT40_01655 [Betaproteobacteria bacterium]|nr:hypothetical protein [Betaproteobacteria bacterium]
MTDNALRARVADLRRRVAQRRSDLQAAYPVGGPASLLRDWGRTVNDALRQVWQMLEMPPDWSLTAVGGYGRGELFPYSDVDLLVLLDAPVGPDEQPLLDRFVGTLWDIGLEVGHSVRTVHESDQSARIALARRQPHLVRAIPCRPRCGHGCAAVRAGQTGGAGTAPRPPAGCGIQPRAQYQGGAGWSARPACGAVDGTRLRIRLKLAGAGTRRPAHRRRSRAHRPSSALFARPPRSPAPAGQAPGGPPAVRLAGTAGARARPARWSRQTRVRVADAALLPHRKGRQPAQHHPAAHL